MQEPNEIDLRMCFTSRGLDPPPAQLVVVPSDMLTCETLSVCKKLSLSPHSHPQMLPDMSPLACRVGGEELRLGSPPVNRVFLSAGQIHPHQLRCHWLHRGSQYRDVYPLLSLGHAGPAP